MDRPNILFIHIDDMGWRDLSCYGSEFYESPTIDKLLADGMHFTDGYAACPVCSPTRAALLTGKYPARLKLTNYIDWGRGHHPLRGRVIDAPYLDRLPSNECSLATALREGGYATWHIGKWHLGFEDTWPERHGFDVNVGGNQWGMPTRGYFAPWHLPNLAGHDVAEGTYLDDYLTDRAVELIRERDAGRPFFLNLWYYSVHTPIQAKPEDIAYFEQKAAAMGLDKASPFEPRDVYPYLGKRDRSERVRHRTQQGDPAYAAMIKNLDRNIARVLSALDDAGVRDDTVVIFTSDNGGLSTGGKPPTCNAPLANGKGWMEEGGTREPWIVRWPGRVAPGSVCHEPITSTDLYPTVLDMAGLDPRPEQHVDGVSFRAALEGRPFERGPVFWHYPHFSNCGGHPGCSVRRGDYKLTRFFEDDHLELYNLREDIGETDNLCDREPERRDELLAVLDRWLHDTGAIFPVRNPEWKEEDHEPGCAPTV